MSIDIIAISLCFFSIALVYVVCELLSVCKRIDEELK